MNKQKIIDTAKLEVGITELPANSNNVKYNTWMYGHEVHDGDKPGARYPWCGAFVSWVYDRAGLPLGSIDMIHGFVGCTYAVGHISKWGKQVTIPEMGDIVFYDWNGDGNFDHTGIFEIDLGKGLFRAYEGNTAFGNDSNGGAVMPRADRKYKNAIFVRPNVLQTTK